MLDQEPKEEKKNLRIGLLVSLGVHGILLLILLFAIAWKEPNPPLPEYGIELNFGMDRQGSGDVQPLDPQPTTPQTESAPKTEASESQDTPEEPVEVSPKVEPSPSVQEQVVTNQPSPDVVEKKPEPKKETPVEKKEEVKEQPKPKPSPQSLYPDATTDSKTDGKASTTSSSQGDDKNKAGDKGDPKGSIDAKALYGQQGGGDGASLDLAGWTWDFRPKPNDTSDESGRIVFEIKIDSRGNIISVRTLERTVSPAVEKIYRDEVQKLTFSKTADNARAADISTGKITFIIRSR